MRASTLACCLLLSLGAPAATAAPEIRRAAVDPEVRFSDGGLSLLVSQTGYADPGIRVAFLMARDRAAGDAVGAWSVEDALGAPVLTGIPVYAGNWMSVHFWRLDLAGLPAPGTFRLRAGGLASQRFPVAAPRALYFDLLIPDLVFAQLSARRRDDLLGGFVDSGNDIRETNSHAVAALGLVDLVERHAAWLAPAERTAIDGFLEHFWRFLAGQQEGTGRFLGGWDRGTAILDGLWPNHFQASTALARLARYYAASDPALAASLLEVVRLAELYSHDYFDFASVHSAFLLLRLEAAATYHLESADATALADARAAALELRRRQVRADAPTPAGLHGLFTEYRSGAGHCRLNHHDFGVWTGAYASLPSAALAGLLRRYPDDPEASEWRSLASEFLAGYLGGGAARSPFGLVPNGEYQGLRWFSDLFHGMSMSYALAASSALEFEPLLDAPALADLAERQLLWIAGLNTGSPFPDGAEPFSCLVGHGYQWLRDGHGLFPDIPGSIVNGLSATPQFVKTMPVDPEQPLHLCDESWIAHTGAWLSATSRLLCARLRLGNQLWLARGGGDVDFSWQAVGGATDYRLRRDVAADGDFATVATDLPGATTVRLPIDTAPLVFYRVTAGGGSCEGPR